MKSRRIKMLTLLILAAAAGQMQAEVGVIVEGKQADTRAVTTNLGQNFLPSTPFDTATGKLFLGASAITVGKEAFAVTAATIDQAANPRTVQTSPLAPDTVKLNSKKAAQPNPLNNNALSAIALIKDNDTFSPIAVTGADQTSLYMPKLSANANGEVVLVNKSKALTTPYPLKDATGGADVNKVHSLTASQTNLDFNDTPDTAPFAFAAVSDNDDWGSAKANTRGIAVVRVAPNNLRPLDATNFTNGGAANKAALVNLAVKGPIAIGKDATLNAGATVNTYWDDQLGKLFVTQSNLKTAADTNAAAIGVVLGGIDKTGPFSFPLTPIIKQEKTFIVNDKTAIFAGKTDGTPTSQVVNLFQPRVMHTSTGKDYLIVTGGVVDAESEATWVNALPLVGTAGDAANIGKLASIKDPTLTLPINAANEAPTLDRTHKSPAFKGTVFTADEQKIVVGNDPRYLSENTTLPIQNIQVINDTVYASVAGDRSDLNLEAGVFQSTALFNTDGLVRAWTPWQREGAGVNAVTGFGVDTNTANVMSLRGDKQTIASSAWGSSENVVNEAKDSTKFTKVLNDNFPSETGGVYKFFNFDEKTPGFLPGQFSMAVAVGNDKVALLQTGNNARVNTVLDPTDKFIVDTNTFIRNDDALKAIAPLTSAEVSRSNLAQKGFLYVGGAQGLARFSKTAKPALGWDGNAGLKALSKTDNNQIIPGPDGNYSFNKIDAFDGHQIAKIAADGEKLWVLALDKLTQTADLTGAVAQDKTFSFPQFGNDLVVAKGATNTVAIVATTTGLFTTVDNKDFQTVDGLDGIPVQLAYLSESKGINSGKGNLLVLTVDTNTNKSKVYRFDVNADATPAKRVLPIGEALTLESVRTAFAPAGGMLLSAQSVTQDNDDLLQVLSIKDAKSISAFLDGNNKFINTPVLDTASGSWMIPGEQVSVNQ